MSFANDIREVCNELIGDGLTRRDRGDQVWVVCLHCGADTQVRYDLPDPYQRSWIKHKDGCPVKTAQRVLDSDEFLALPE